MHIKAQWQMSTHFLYYLGRDKADTWNLPLTQFQLNPRISSYSPAKLTPQTELSQELSKLVKFVRQNKIQTFLCWHSSQYHFQFNAECSNIQENIIMCTLEPAHHCCPTLWYLFKGYIFIPLICTLINFKKVGKGEWVLAMPAYNEHFN